VMTKIHKIEGVSIEIIIFLGDYGQQ
jgi:hypothetical protein